jgi:hypothetical protein
MCQRHAETLRASPMPSSIDELKVPLTDKLAKYEMPTEMEMGASPPKVPGAARLLAGLESMFFRWPTGADTIVVFGRMCISRVASA